MLKILSGRYSVRYISKNGIRNIRKYSGDCPKPEYECPHTKKPTSAEIREQRLKSIVHPFLKKNDCKHATKFWKMIFITVCIPSMIVGYIIAFYVTPPPKRPPFLEYRHLRIRNKPFPWGDGNKTLFHNPRTNALPTGYETDEDDDE